MLGAAVMIVMRVRLSMYIHEAAERPKKVSGGVARHWH